MSMLTDATPAITVRLYKTISRKTLDGVSAVSERYQGKDEYISLTPFLGDNSSVRTIKSVRDPAGGFNITFSDQPSNASADLESLYGLIEPMDGVEIRMWGGVGPMPDDDLPIIMRGFVTNVSRSQAMGDNGKPMRTVTVTGQDYGKIWQMYQIIHLKAYSESKSLLTTFALWELFGLKAQNTKPASELVKDVIEKIINPFLKKMLPEHWPMPTSILTDDVIVKRGVMNNSYQNHEGSIYSMLIDNTDVPTWNELYIEDREDGVHVVYRPIPALKLSQDKGDKNRKIQQDAPDPIYCEIYDSDIQAISVERTDASVANFYWVNNVRYDLIDEIQRKLQSIPANDKRVSTEDYPNSNEKYYGVRPLYASTQLSGDAVKTVASGQDKDGIEKNQTVMLSWLDQRRMELMEMNKDNVVLERGIARVKGGQMRPDGVECMKAGDYAKFIMGTLVWDAYCTQIEHEFIPYSGYTTTIHFERGEGFATRISLEQGSWLIESASRGLL